jgi:hypothetical protein
MALPVAFTPVVMAGFMPFATIIVTAFVTGLTGIGAFCMAFVCYLVAITRMIQTSGVAAWVG